MTYKCLDTNIILADANNLVTMCKDGSTLVLPETVIQELDSKKSGFDEINFQAREFARTIASLKQIGDPIYISPLTITRLERGDIRVEIVSSNTYGSIDAATPLSIIQDQRIIETAKRYTSAYPDRNVEFYSIDVMCRITANAAGLAVGIVDEKKEIQLELLKTIELDSSLFNSLEGKPIKDYDPDHVYSNFSYEFVSPDGNSERGIIENGIIKLLKEDEFNKLIVKPINMKQKLWCKALLSDRYDVNILEAKAGTGKNLTSISCAMRLVDENPMYSKIIYVRNSIESVDKGADVGYLAGNDEKFRVYNMPLYDTVEFLAKANCRVKNPTRESIDEKISELMTKYAIECVWVGEMRGRTLSNAIVIMDEWQNSSDNTTQLVLSRLDNTCKAVIIGSNKQIDNPYLNKRNNGLTSLKHDLVNESNVTKFSIDLDKSVRGKYAEYAENLYEPAQ